MRVCPTKSDPASSVHVTYFSFSPLIFLAFLRKPLINSPLHERRIDSQSVSMYETYEYLPCPAIFIFIFVFDYFYLCCRMLPGILLATCLSTSYVTYLLCLANISARTSSPPIPHSTFQLKKGLGDGMRRTRWDGTGQDRADDKIAQFEEEGRGGGRRRKGRRERDQRGMFLGRLNRYWLSSIASRLPSGFRRVCHIVIQPRQTRHDNGIQ